MKIGGQPRHHDSKKQVPIASSENYGANATRVGWVPQSGLVQCWLYENGRVATAQWEHWWGRKTLTSHQWPQWVTKAAGQGAIPVVENPDDISLVIAGGNLHIPQHAYLPTWGFPPCRITQRVDIGVKEF